MFQSCCNVLNSDYLVFRFDGIKFVHSLEGLAISAFDAGCMLIFTFACMDGQTLAV